MKEEILIIPDVHGREFWREPVEKHQGPIIFLGDYVDPYEYWEGISMKKSVEVFKDIVGLKKERPEDITLLLGNHDAHYIWKEAPISTRFDPTWQPDLYREVEFKIALEIGAYLFTHAGLTKKWLKTANAVIARGENETLELYLQRLGETEDGRALISCVGRSRGGRALSGGPMWADWNDDHYDESPIKEGVIQIFGHTQVGSEPEHNETGWCLDCRKAFILNTNEGTIREA